MTETIEGSIEIISGDQSIGIVGVRWDPLTVPVVLGTLYGVTDMESVAPIAVQTGRVPACQWRGRDASNQDVDVMLWPDVPFDPSMLDGGTA